jgi:hypothetical protein
MVIKELDDELARVVSNHDGFRGGYMCLISHTHIPLSGLHFLPCPACLGYCRGRHDDLE